VERSRRRLEPRGGKMELVAGLMLFPIGLAVMMVLGLVIAALAGGLKGGPYETWGNEDA
jgi:hypothetical protein